MGFQRCIYDEKDAVGRRYRRQDAIGTPFCITVDHQTIARNNTVTVRYRDSNETRTCSNVKNLNALIDDHVSIKNWLKNC